MINNRQAGRRRGRGGNNGGGQRQGGNPGRPDTGNRIDNRARGNAAQLHEKYKTLARDAQMQGDRVNTEYYLQFADHYFRVLAESRARYDEQHPNQQPQRMPSNDLSDDDDYELEGEAGTQDEPQRPQPQMRDGGNREDRGNRDERPRDERPRDDRPREYRDARPNREPRGNRDGGDQQQSEPRRRYESDRDEAPREQAAREPAPREEAAPAPRRARAPRVTANEEAGPDTFDAAVLPPALGTSEPEADGEEKPRRRRGRPPASETAAA